jgi:hypothetical protein
LDECAKNRIFVPQIEINDKIRKHEKDYFSPRLLRLGQLPPGADSQGGAARQGGGVDTRPADGQHCGSFYAQMLAPIVSVYYIDKVWGLFGEMAFWVRPEKMFFEKVTRDGRTFNRFLETEI